MPPEPHGPDAPLPTGSAPVEAERPREAWRTGSTSRSQVDAAPLRPGRLRDPVADVVERV